MKTNELNNGMKEQYTKPALEVEEMEVQWDYLGGTTFSALTDVTYNSFTEDDWSFQILEWIEAGVDESTIPNFNHQCD